MSRDITVTTSSTLEGWEVQKQLGIVTTHVVAGTNVFSDVFASWRDFFGGQSKTYQKQLSWINDNAINQLKKEASSRGANAIIALKIDHDEISGESKSMFMVTVTGTAVKADPPADYETTKDAEFSEISKEDLHDLMDVERIKNEINQMAEGNGRYVLEDEELELLLKYKVKSVIHPILQIFGTNHIDTTKRRWKDNLIEICRVVDRDEVKDLLYSSLEAAQDSSNHTYILDVIDELNLLDYDWADRFLSSDSLDKQKVGLELLTYDKLSYSEEDITQLEKLTDLTNRFVRQAEVIEKEKMLSSKTKKQWKCECGCRNKMEVKRCYRCDKDMYGFKKGEETPSDVEGLLKEKLTVLKRYI